MARGAAGAGSGGDRDVAEALEPAASVSFAELCLCHLQTAANDALFLAATCHAAGVGDERRRFRLENFVGDDHGGGMRVGRSCGWV